MSIGGLLSIVVLIVVVVALVFAATAPDWLDRVLIGALACAILLSAWPIAWKRVG